MRARFRSILAIAIILVIVILLIIVEIRLYGTGFAGKTLWDWLQLLSVLAIPVVVGFGAVWFTARQNHDREITLDNQRETMLQTYLDKMTELLLHENLRKADINDDVVYIARARTLTALAKLDPNRKRSIIIFLYESGLIDFDVSIIDLKGADLSGVDLNKLDLGFISFEGANVQGADFSGANLSMADLKEANSFHTNFSGTDLHLANLQGVIGITEDELEKQAKSLKGATMPDGSIHP